MRGLLGRGGMARIYKVTNPVIGRIVALKQLEPRSELEALMGAGRLRRLFEAEARTMAGLRHPNLVQVLDYGTARGRPFYVMDFHAVNLGDILGETYRTEAPTRILRLDRAVSYACQVLDGLGRLHFADVIHRDIKPFNLLVSDDDRIRIGDFGLSKVRGERFDAPGNLKVGSPYYAAPEQEVAPDTVGPAADLFSVGVMLCRMLTGSLPDRGGDPPSRINPDLDSAWDALLEKAAAHRPADRFQSARQMKAALEDLFNAWKERQEGICAVSADTRAAPATGSAGFPRRRVPVKIRPVAARGFFGLDDRWRPQRFPSPRFRPEGQATVTDSATGLTWERAGTPYPVTWREAHRYVAGLNRSRPTRRGEWRLPTVDELTTLISETPHGTDHCIDPVFDPTQLRLWSCDRCSFISAWYVDAQLGFVHHQDLDAPFYVRAVCG
ncbi:MAG: protein kinase [Desulfobacterales bacterium]